MKRRARLFTVWYVSEVAEKLSLFIRSYPNKFIWTKTDYAAGDVFSETGDV